MFPLNSSLQDSRNFVEEQAERLQELVEMKGTKEIVSSRNETGSHMNTQRWQQHTRGLQRSNKDRVPVLIRGSGHDAPSKSRNHLQLTTLHKENFCFCQQSHLRLTYTNHTEGHAQGKMDTFSRFCFWFCIIMLYLGIIYCMSHLLIHYIFQFCFLWILYVCMCLTCVCALSVFFLFAKLYSGLFVF